MFTHGCWKMFDSKELVVTDYLLGGVVQKTWMIEDLFRFVDDKHVSNLKGKACNRSVEEVKPCFLR